ncbi:hypothetical protein BDZ91DRAFT_840913 [Kalaharituber pfeilii]|nr:hypothetical protein BDZ91DRAFT_840913 [Kalaharituber pfeilii]
MWKESGIEAKFNPYKRLTEKAETYNAKGRQLQTKEEERHVTLLEEQKKAQSCWRICVKRLDQQQKAVQENLDIVKFANDEGWEIEEHSVEEQLQQEQEAVTPAQPQEEGNEESPENDTSEEDEPKSPADIDDRND